MAFTLMNFEHSNGARQFAFRNISPDRSKTTVIVSADLQLARKYDISVQSLPLICSQMLDAADCATVAHGFVSLTEEHMCAENRAARERAAGSRKKRTPSNVTRPLVG